MSASDRRRYALDDSAQIEDSRVRSVREILADSAEDPTRYGLLGPLFDWAVEVYRVSIGHATENVSLRKQVREPEKVDLTGIPSAVLLAEIERRLP